MRIATWNVNSVTARADRVAAWLDASGADVLCLQELKCSADAFPPVLAETLARDGYEVAAHGSGRWNGVAVASRVGLADVVRGLPGEPEFEGARQERAVGATCGGVRVWSLYVPNGRDPAHPHYAYKLAWLAALRDAAAAELAADPARPYALLGDFNIAPTDSDVWDPAVFAGATHVTAPERAALAGLRAAGLDDVVPRALKYARPYTYWDYRQLAFPKNNGMRIDLVYANGAFRDRVADAFVDREERRGKGASDHAPVVVDLEDPS